MSTLAFFDTNVLVYQDDTSSPAKQDRALGIFSEHFGNGTATLSLQVLQEYFNAATRKLNLDPERAQRRVEIFALANMVRFEVTDVIAAIELHRLLGCPDHPCCAHQRRGRALQRRLSAWIRARWRAYRKSI